MRLGGGKARAFAIAVALLLARCTLSPHPEDPGLNDKGTPGGSSHHSTDAGALPVVNGSGGSAGSTASGSGGSSVPRSPDSGSTSATPGDASASPDAGTDSGANDAGVNADAADAR